MTKKNPAITTPTHHSNILTSVKASLPPPTNTMKSMTKGHGKSVRPAVDQVEWLSSVNVMHRREGSVERPGGSGGRNRSRGRSESLHTRNRARIDSTETGGSGRDDESYPATLKDE
jgi:hypothetical protein